jgi:hypothetical protein
MSGSLSPLVTPFMTLVQAILDVPARSQQEIEVMLWQEWVPRIKPPYDELNHTVIRERLQAVGLGDFLFLDTKAAVLGPWAGDKIPTHAAAKITSNAKYLWLAERGVKSDFDNSYMTSLLFETGTAVQAIEQARVVGKQGTFKFMDDIVVNGAEFQLARSTKNLTYPPLHINEGDSVFVDSVWPDWAFLARLADRYRAAGEDWTKEGLLTEDLVGVQVVWEHGRGTFDRPFGPPR